MSEESEREREQQVETRGISAAATQQQKSRQTENLLIWLNSFRLIESDSNERLSQLSKTQQLSLLSLSSLALRRKVAARIKNKLECRDFVSTIVVALFLLLLLLYFNYETSLSFTRITLRNNWEALN